MQRPKSPRAPGYLHAQWRRAVTDRDHPEYAIVDDIRGQGKYAGTFLAWTQLSDGWFGEGEIKFFIDGDKEFPTICGTGTEDYFCAKLRVPRDLQHGLRRQRAQASRRRRPPQVEPLPLAHPGSDLLPAGSARHHPGPGLVAQRRSTSRWPMTSPRWPTGTSPNRTRPFRSCPGWHSAGPADQWLARKGVAADPGRQSKRRPAIRGPVFKEFDMAQLTLATCQFEIRTQVAKNLRSITRQMKQAKSRGADLVSLFRGLPDRLPGERTEVRPGNGLGSRFGRHGRDHGAGRRA